MSWRKREFESKTTADPFLRTPAEPDRAQRRRRGLLVCFAILFGSPLLGSPIGAEERPNLLFILTDDQRYDSLGCAGHALVKTPTIDRLAADGVRFEHAFVTTPICAASRASILTGTWELRHGYTFGTDPLQPTHAHASYPALLKAAGYRTGFVGKFGIRSEIPPRKSLFDEFHPMGQPFWRQGKNGERRHLTELIGDTAKGFLRRTSDEQPFCLSISFAAPHAVDGGKAFPYPAPNREKDRYAKAQVPAPLVPTSAFEDMPPFLRDSMHRDRWHWRWDTPEKYNAHTRAYFAMITAVDRVVGEIWSELEKRGFEENTVVIFTSDNGYYLGSRGFAGKWSHYDESLRVPLVIRDPRISKKLRGRVATEFALNVDLAPTLLDLAGVSPPTTMQGRSLLPVLEGKPTRWRREFFGEHRFDHERIPKWEGIRGERYVYARYYENLPEGELLHDLTIDPFQLRNLAKDPAYAEVLETLRKRCEQRRSELR
ncbi:MAG: sulfatase [Planctomycetota bacterium]